MIDRRFFLMSASGAVVAPQAAYGPASTADAPDAQFSDWMAGFIQRAAAQGWTPGQLQETFAGLTADPRVIAADSRQPELVKPIGAYIEGVVSPARVADGQAHLETATPWLSPISLRYGVPAEICVAIWAVESGYGRNEGDMDVVRSLATIAAEGRRKGFAEDQLFASLRILYTGQATREQLKGSWAGAMGQTQFTPADYLTYAVDADGDGRRDIWGSAPDALASTANFLHKKAQWRRGESWTREVILPAGFDYGLAEGPKQTQGQWSALGVRTADGAAWREADAAEPAQLLLPAGWMGPALLAYPNHFAIRAYNNSMSYALAVGFLAGRIAGAPPLVRPWPQDEPIPRADRVAAQMALQRLGYDVGEADGVLGAKTRQAARLWQKSRGLPPDGYLTYALIQRLKADAAAAPAPAQPLPPASPASPYPPAQPAQSLSPQPLPPQPAAAAPGPSAAVVRNRLGRLTA